MQNPRNQFVALIIVTLVATFVALPIPSKPRLPLLGFLTDAKMQLGIDLAGGAELTYRALFNEKEAKGRETLQQVVSVLQNRINKRGLKDPKINAVGDDMISIQLAGVDKDALIDYKKLIEGVGKLELREVADTETMERFNTSGTVPDEYEVKVHRQHASTEHKIKDKVLLRRDSVIGGQDISNSSPEQSLRGGDLGMSVRFWLHPNGAKKFDESAYRLYHRSDKTGEPKGMIAILLDGEIQSMPVVNAEHFGGEGVIEGSFDKQSANDLSIVLKSGSLPVPIGRRTTVNGKSVDQPKIPEAENWVGPSLGQDSILRGMTASVLSIVLVALFMVVYYRAGGVVSVVGLLLNMVFLFALMAIMGATLTLPGIAGIVLTIGMAVDANILIYERVREEMERGKTAIQAFEAGHDRAFVTIVDSNLTTLVAAVVLYYVGTGAIQGFAITLMLGILTTMVSVLWSCKLILHMLVMGGTITQWKMMKFFSVPSIDYIKMLKPAVAISLVAILAGMGVFFARGKDQYGIDFTGGTKLNFAFAKAVGIDDVREGISSIKGTDGLPAYPDAEIQTVATSGADVTEIKLVSGAESTEFQMRTKDQDSAVLRSSLMTAFSPPAWKGPALAREPFAEVAKNEIPDNDRWCAPQNGGAGAPGGGWWVYFVDDGSLNLPGLTKKLIERFKRADQLTLTKDVNGDPIFGGDTGAHELVKAESPAGLAKVKVLFCKQDVESVSDDTLRKVRDELKKAGAEGMFKLSEDPFSNLQNIGPAVAEQLWNSTIWAMIISWGLMIVYITIRFRQASFGVAAVIALVHDALIALGFTSLAGLLIPKSWGLSFEMNMSTVAAILTIIGYSINDTIVTFDRIRENLHLMKKESFADIINASVNQTLGRTILTAFTVWVTCMVLYLFTMTAGGGIASFSFPMLIGVIAGSYSSIYIAAPILLFWFKGQRPQAV